MAMRAHYPLDGVRVLDLTRLLPGGFCSLMLADLGADVVKVEDPGPGDYGRSMPPFLDTPDGPLGAMFAALNRGKRSVALDLKSAAGRDDFLRLVARADVVVEGFRPGVMARLGLDAMTLLAVNPRLVYCALTGYGQDGPRALAAGHDINYIGVAGLLDGNGAPGGPPTIPGAQAADLSGAYAAALGILAALLRRERVGVGGVVDIAMAEAVFALVSLPWAEWAATGAAAGRGAHLLSGGWACYNVYAAGDGRSVAVGCLEPKFWAAFCGLIGHPEWVADQFEAACQPALRAAVAEALAARPADEWASLAEPLDVPLTRVSRLAEVVDEPQFAAREVFLRTSGGALAARTPIRIDGLAAAATSAPPRQGETNVANLIAAWTKET